MHVPETFLRGQRRIVDSVVAASGTDRLERVRDELDALRYLHCADTSGLESALTGSELILSVADETPADTGLSRIQVSVIPGLGGDFLPCLAAFTGLDRFEAWHGSRDTTPLRLPAIACWTIAVRCGCAGVGIDPGHATQFKLSAGGLRRLIRRSLSQQVQSK